MHLFYDKSIKVDKTSYVPDIDECTSVTHKCSADAVCSNTEGSYSCSCNAGLHGDGRYCEGELTSDVRLSLTSLVAHYCRSLSRFV